MQHTKVFPNGFRLAVDENPSSYSVSTGICVGAGSCLENKTDNGFSHFIEHMMFKGTSKRTAFGISDAMDRIGGKINAFTSKDMTCYFARTASGNTGQAAEILGDMFFNSLFDETELEREKKVIIEEITMGEDQPDEVCQDLIAEAVFGSHPLAQTIIGCQERIKTATRADLLEFIEKYYKTENVVLSFAGNITLDEASKYAETYFIPYLKNSGTVKTLEKAKKHSNFLSRVKDVEQAHICAAFPSISCDDELLPAASVFTNIFGGGMSSRLFQKIREEHGMAYSVFAFNSVYVNNGYFEIYAGTAPKNVEKVVSLMREEILKVISGLVTEDELLRGKEQLKGSLLLAQESSVTVMSNLARHLLRIDELISVEEQVRRIDAVSMSDIERVVKLIFNPQYASMAVVGKEKTNEKLLHDFRW